MAKITDTDELEAPEWIVTFSDIISLLVTFFILLITYSAVDAEKIKLVANGSLQAFRGILDSKHSKQRHNLPSLQSRSVSFIKVPKNKYSEIPGPTTSTTKEKKSSYPADLRNPLAISDSEHGTSFRLRTRIFFAPGSSELPDNAYRQLASIANALEYSHNYLLIKSYADVSEVADAPKSYILAGKRAYRVWKYFADKCHIPARRITIAACSLAKPAADMVQRQQARTVEIIIWDRSVNGTY